MLGLLVIAIAPAAALFVFFYARDRHQKEPFGILIKTFILGVLAFIPASVTSLSLERLTGWHSNTTNLLHGFLGALFIVGFVEEGCKYVVVRFYAYHKREFDEPYDGIMYSVAAALGFATVENVLYVISQGAGAGVLRAFLAVPGHAFDGVLMGYFLGLAKFQKTDARGNWLSGFGFGLAVFAHGIYDFIIFSLDKAPLLLLSLLVLAVLSWVVIFKATRNLSDRSPHIHPDLAAPPEPPPAPPPADSPPPPED